jgi:hypothetical protein
MKYLELLNIIKMDHIDSINILGSGPSLCKIDINKFANKNCVFINSSIIISPYVQAKNKFFVSTDSLILNWSYSNLLLNMNYLILRENIKFISRYPNAYFFSCNDDYQSAECKVDDIVGFSSLIAAVNIFIKLNCTNINIYGFDCKEDECGNNYFWQKCYSSNRPFFINDTKLNSTDSLKKQYYNWDLQKKFIDILSKYGNIKIHHE